MASLILQGTPAVVEGAGAGGGVQSVTAGTYLINNGSATAVQLASTLTAGDGIEIGAGVVNPISVNLAAGAGIEITPPAAAGDPITIAATGGGGVTAVNGGVGITVNSAVPATPAVALNFSPASAEFDMYQIGRAGAATSGPTNYVAPYTGWFVFQPTLVMGNAGFTFPAGSSIQFWIGQGAVPDVNSLVCFTSAAQAPAGGGTLGKLEDTRNAVVYLTAGQTYTPSFQWSAGVDMGIDGGASVYMLPLFAA